MRSMQKLSLLFTLAVFVISVNVPLQADEDSANSSNFFKRPVPHTSSEEHT